jgi:hypothetical protein
MHASTGADRVQPVAGERLLHPVMLLAVGILFVNDQLLKGLWPGALTGKLSDFAGLIFFPVFLHALWEVSCQFGGRRRAHSRHVLFGCAALTTAVFAFVKLSPHGAQLYRYGLGALRGLPAAALDLMQGEAPRLTLVRFTQDPSDLIALPAVLVGLWLFREGRGGG